MEIMQWKLVQNQQVFCFSSWVSLKAGDRGLSPAVKEDFERNEHMKPRYKRRERG